MIGITEISSALNGIKIATDIVRGIGSLKTETEINQAVIDIQRVLLDAQNLTLQDRARQADLLQKISDLEKKIGEISTTNDERDRYELVEFQTGVMAYVLKDECANGEPSHKICAKCFNEGKKSILQVYSRHSGGESVRCMICAQNYTLQSFPKVRSQPALRRSWMDR